MNDTATTRPQADESEVRLPDDVVRKLRRTRRHPRPAQWDYLHLRYLVRALARAFSEAPPPVRDVLDIWCGTRPYDDLLPAGARCVGMDRSNFSGVVDVVSEEFLPFPDESFDLVFCTEAFDFVPDPPRAVDELGRVLRPGGTAILTVSLVWEYDRQVLQHRYTGPALAHLFRDWDDVKVVENGGFAVSWATLTSRMVRALHDHLPAALRTISAPLFAGAYLLLNGLGALLDLAERRLPDSSVVLPMNLLVSARRPRLDQAPCDA